jgi:hypothetical protein
MNVAQEVILAQRPFISFTVRELHEFIGINDEQLKTLMSRPFDMGLAIVVGALEAANRDARLELAMRN